MLLTADDIGAARSSKNEPQSRARQNAIFELGYFVGVQGRSNVVALREDGVEMPSVTRVLCTLTSIAAMRGTCAWQGKLRALALIST